jgi:hypothetical protein
LVSAAVAAFMLLMPTGASLVLSRPVPNTLPRVDEPSVSRLPALSLDTIPADPMITGATATSPRIALLGSVEFQWSVEIATAFSKEQALDAFNRMKQDHVDVLGNYEPIVVE